MSKPQRSHSTIPSVATRPIRFARQTRFQILLAVLMLALIVGSLARPLSTQADALSRVHAQTSGETTNTDDGGLPGNGLEPLLGELPSGDIPLDIPDAALPDLETESPGLGNSLIFPDPALAWGDATVLTVADILTRFDGLVRVETNGDFQFFYAPGADGGGSIRILPFSGVAADDDRPLFLDLAWVLGDDWLLPLPAGQRVDVELGARLYSPPAGVDFSIRERVDGVWQSSSVNMQDIQWNTYGLAREIDPDADQVQIALRWQPELPNAWVEFQFPHVVIGRPRAVAAALSPTDTPTPTPEPTATPTPTSEIVDEEPEPVEEAAAPAEPAEVPAEEPAKEPAKEPEEEVPMPTPTPFLIIVTSTPTPEDVFEEATRVALATAWVPILGTSTPTPENMVTPTNTPTPFVIVVTHTPVPGNAATAVYQEKLATAIAFTTGTPTPFPEEAEIVVATHTPLPQPRPTNTPTPLYILLDELPPTATPRPTVEFPGNQLIGKIMFLSDYQASVRSPNVLIMNADGSGLGIMETRMFYNRAVARDAYSPDRRFHVYVQREGNEANGRWLQIKVDDHYYSDFRMPQSHFNNGHAWAPVWSPTRHTMAFVANDSGNDEIYVVNLNEWPAMQLTRNDWEWDHHPSFSPDGAQIVFSSNRNTGTRQIWMMDASGGNQRQITNFPFQGWNPVWVKYPDS